MKAAIAVSAAVLFLAMMSVAADDGDDDYDVYDLFRPRHCHDNKDCSKLHCPVGMEPVCIFAIPYRVCICKAIEKYCRKDKNCHCKPGQWARCLKKRHCDIGRCVCEHGPKPGFCKKASDCNKVCPAGSIKHCHKKPHCDIGECKCLHPKFLLGGDEYWE